MYDYVITGGAGFIGSNLATYYLDSGYRVALFDNFSRQGAAVNAGWLKQKFGDLVTVYEGDVRDPGVEFSRVIEGATAVFHLAGQVAVTTSVTDPQTDFAINALGTFKVLEVVRHAGGGAAVLYSSTNKVYGSMSRIETVQQERRYEYAAAGSGISEEQPLDFHSPYGCSKGAGDQYVRDYARTYGLKTVVFRQSCIYGPRQFGIEDQGWVAWFAIRALQGLPITIYGDGKQVRDVLFVEDLVAAYDAAVNSIDKTSGQVFNIGGGPGNTLSLLELIEMLEAHLGRAIPYEFESRRIGDQFVYVSDIRKAREEFGWIPKVTVSEGVSRLVTWLQDNEHLFAPKEQGVSR
jgi:CDP-paratose 2-epimerase